MLSREYHQQPKVNFHRIKVLTETISTRHSESDDVDSQVHPISDPRT
jgi:hypothetical protein